MKYLDSTFLHHNRATNGVGGVSLICLVPPIDRGRSSQPTGPGATLRLAVLCNPRSRNNRLDLSDLHHLTPFRRSLPWRPDARERGEKC